jgi:hypothetical protein
MLCLFYEDINILYKRRLTQKCMFTADISMIDKHFQNCMYLQRLSKKSKNNNFNNFAINKINSLQTSKLQI